MDAKNKILVAGDVDGKFKALFNRVETVNKKAGPFDALFCVGNFFGDSNIELMPYKNGAKSIPVPTFILGPNRESDQKHYEGYENEDICQNLTYIGKRGLYNIASGLKVAYVSGVQGQESSESTFTQADVVAVKNSCIVGNSTLSDYRGVDILITSQWPEGIQETDPSPANTSKLISWLANEIKPRYHFCGLNGVYHERLPYRNTISSNTQLELATRFIAMARVGNAEKAKYVYALNITPVEKMRILDLIQKTIDETPCPYANLTFSDKQLAGSHQEKSSQYFYDMEEHDDRHHGKRRKMSRPPRQNFDQEKCWFCLSSQNVEKHLVISIGDNFYLALAKGPLNEEHLLILSITHIQCAAMLNADDWMELEKFKSTLKRYFKSRNKVVCFFERNYKSSHFQMNAVAVDTSLEWQFKHVFEDKSEEYNLAIETMPKLTEPNQLPDSGAYFYAELPDGTTMLTRQMRHFPIHFGREVMCSENLLNCENKVDWKECQLEKDEEVNLVARFRENYKEFDFTL